MTLTEFLAERNLTDVPATAFGCAWFVRCDRDATHYESAGPVGWVPACDRCPTIGQ